MEPVTLWFLSMHFPARLIQLRKALGLTQQALVEAAALHVNQIRRYEAGTAQPTLEALIRLARALHVRLDDLVFAENERGPDDDLMLQFEAVSQFSEEEKQTVRDLLEGLILKHTARRWDSSRSAASTPAKKPGNSPAAR
ncbi:MAG TPA: helix-turn-helix transcriptional regulator [Rhodocyclaceae bacterium]|nr:helix-turn-helix transcriptional regulator [Rhodocyclaceae bacterium]HNL15336.1 helix-turn-helix transcriptional regulator [Accumulibacter sp.]